MKRILIAMLGLLAVLAAHAAGQRTVSLDRNVDEVAKILQARLPTLAADGMCEVERESNGWNFSFQVKADKAAAEVVQVILRRTEAHRSELRVQGVRVEGSLVGSKRSAIPELSQAWTDRILALLEPGA